MAKSIEEEIVDYLKESEMYYVEEYDEEGFPIDNGAYDLLGDITNFELCDITIESMEYIADVQRKIDIEKACEWLLENANCWMVMKQEMFVAEFRKAMEE